MDNAFEDKAEADITGVVYSYSEKETYLYDVSLSTAPGIFYKLSNLLVYKMPYCKAGSRIQIHGIVYKTEKPTNEGQFNQRDYLREKNIYYTAVAKSVAVSNSNIYPKNFYNSYLEKIQNVKEKLTGVYVNTLPEKECGIVTAMLLGSKTLLDINIKKLYQKSGISHLLAISGLHISIIGMAIYKLVTVFVICICSIIKRIYVIANGISEDDITKGYLKITDCICTAVHSVPAFTAIAFVIMYGRMTGFSISVTRAVIMTVIMLFAPIIRRSYDMVSAMAISAVIILFQKPFAVYSCSFLLSFGAVIGIALVYPVLKKICIKKQKDSNKNILHILIEKVLSIFLSSIATQLTTLPFILYFYYEFPLYGIFINIIAIPLASLLVIVCAIGGVIGTVCMPLAKFILGSAYILLNIYETICKAVAKLPCNIIIIGKPSIWQMVVYFALLGIALIAVYFYDDNEDEEDEYLATELTGYTIKAVFFIAISTALFTITVVNTYTKKYSGLKLVFLDVGQGDAIFMQDNSGVTYLIDGGSSSVSSIGEYRIIPYLKCNGISRIDYMIMTHSDKDHISGLEEVLQQSSTGIKVKNLLLPNPSGECKEVAYFEMAELANENSVHTAYIEAGDVFFGSDGFSIRCLHPEIGFNAESTNAYSTALSVTYGNTSFLLTGDIEENGEDALLEKLQNDSTLPEKYDVLKVAHHGSKNSTSDEFLERVSPDISIISCGKNNRYRHPHKELIERLQKSGSRWVATKDAGAVTVLSDGKNIKIALLKK